MNTYIVYIAYKEMNAHYISESKVLEMKEHYVSELKVLVNAEDGDAAMDIAQDLFKRDRLKYMNSYKIIRVKYVEISLPCLISS